MRRIGALSALVALLGVGAPPPALTAKTLCPPTMSGPYDHSGTLNVLVAGEPEARCGLPLREHHDAKAILSGADGLLYVAESVVGYSAGDTDAGVVDVFARDGTLMRRISEGIAGPRALALDERGRLFVSNSGNVVNRGYDVSTPPHVSVYAPGAIVPSATYPLPPRAGASALLLAPDGDLIVGDIEPGVVGRFRPGEPVPRSTYRFPSSLLRVRPANDASLPRLSLRSLRFHGPDAIVALFTVAGEDGAFVEWSLASGRVVRGSPVPYGSGLVVDAGGRAIVAAHPVALIFDAAASNRSGTLPTEDLPWVATDALGRPWFAGKNAVAAFDGTGARVAEFAIDPRGPVSLVDAPTGRAPMAQETASPALATPAPPSLAEVSRLAAGARGIAYDRVVTFGLSAPLPLELSFAGAMQLRGGSIGGVQVPPEFMHVAILGPFARIANGDESVVEIIDCIHRTVTSFSPAKHIARVDEARPDLGPEPSPDPGSRAIAEAIMHVRFGVRAGTRSTLDGVPATRYDVETAVTAPKGTPAAGAAQVAALLGVRESLLIADTALPALPCPRLNVPPTGGIPHLDAASGASFGLANVDRLMHGGVGVTRTGPSLPNRFVLAETGSAGAFGYFYVRVGRMRPLSAADASLFAVPAGTRIDPSAPTLDGAQR